MQDGVSTILLLEDNIAISKLLCIVLRRQGYTVLAASNGSDALRLGQRHQNALDLVLSDVVLRNELAAPVVARLRELRPEAGVIYLSGSNLELLFERGYLEPGILSKSRTLFLQKPFPPEVLVQTVETLLHPEIVANEADRGCAEVKYIVRHAY